MRICNGSSTKQQQRACDMTQPLKPASDFHSGITGEVLGDQLTKRKKPEPTAVVIFGATGDLSGRKLAPALFNLMLDNSMSEPTVIIGVSRNAMPVAKFAEHLRPRVSEF